MVHSVKFYKIDYVRVDPNIPYTIGELRASQHRICPKEENQLVRDDAREKFGTEIWLFKKEYNFKKIMKDFNFDKLPHFERITQKEVWFTDGERYIPIQKALISNYIDTNFDPYLVYYMEELFRVEQDIAPLAIFIESTFMEERNISISNGDILRLSLEQIKVINSMIKGSALLNTYNNDTTDLYVVIE